MPHRCLFLAWLMISGFGLGAGVPAYARGVVTASGPGGCPTAIGQVGLLGSCMAGPLVAPPPGCGTFDLNADARVDLRDAALVWIAFGQGNDSCACPTAVTDGATVFNNTGATDDGPAEPGICTFFGDSRIQSDVWFSYRATCTGELVVSLCGSDFDSKMAVYTGSACPTVEPTVCSDDDCGPGAISARVAFQAVFDEQYLIRVGGFEGAQGAGTLSIRCGVDICAGAAGECFAEHGNAGCSDATCCTTTCDTDPFCCDVTWDSFCAGSAEGLCTGSFPACAAGAGPCDAANGTGGCDGVDCCNTVCMNDPFCCVTEWDDICAASATGICGLTCGGTSGSCFLLNGSPGCDDVTCCQNVCATNPFCCDTTWDQQCVDDANALCR